MEASIRAIVLRLLIDGAHGLLTAHRQCAQVPDLCRLQCSTDSSRQSSVGCDLAHVSGPLTRLPASDTQCMVHWCLDMLLNIEKGPSRHKSLDASVCSGQCMRTAATACALLVAACRCFTACGAALGPPCSCPLSLAACNLPLSGTLPFHVLFRCLTTWPCSPVACSCPALTGLQALAKTPLQYGNVPHSRLRDYGEKVCQGQVAVGLSAGALSCCALDWRLCAKTHWRAHAKPEAHTTPCQRQPPTSSDVGLHNIEIRNRRRGDRFSRAHIRTLSGPPVGVATDPAPCLVVACPPGRETEGLDR